MTLFESFNCDPQQIKKFWEATGVDHLRGQIARLCQNPGRGDQPFGPLNNRIELMQILDRKRIKPVATNQSTVKIADECEQKQIGVNEQVSATKFR